MATNILDTIDLHRIGELLQQARKKCGMTQSEAAQVIDAVRTTVVAIEKGERRLKPAELIKLARAYGRASLMSSFSQVLLRSPLKFSSERYISAMKGKKQKLSLSFCA